MSVIELYNEGKLSWDELNAMTIIDCSNSKVTSIPILENLQELVCHNCTGLTVLPTLQSLQKLDCVGCTNLTSIPILSLLSSLILLYP